ncbi:hypothetical protein D3C76_1305430 [compost metagenome]
MLLGQLTLAFTTEHDNRLITGDGPRNQAQGRLHVSGEILPDGLLCAKGDEGLLLLLALVRHVPTALAGGLHLRRSQAKAGEGDAHTGENR